MAKQYTYPNHRILIQPAADDMNSHYASPAPKSSSSSSFSPYAPLPSRAFSSSFENWSYLNDTAKSDTRLDFYCHEDPMLGYPFAFDQHQLYELPTSTSAEAPIDFSIQASGTAMWSSPKTDADEYVSASPRTPSRSQSPPSVYQNQVLLPPSSVIIPASDHITLGLDTNGPLASLTTSATTTTLTDLYYSYSKNLTSGNLTSAYQTNGSDLSLLFAAENSARTNPNPDVTAQSPLIPDLSDIEWCFSGEDEDEDVKYNEDENSASGAAAAAAAAANTITSTPEMMTAPKAWLSSSQEFEPQAEMEEGCESSDSESTISQDGSEPLIVETHPLNLLLVDLREKMMKFPTAIPEDQWEAIHQKVTSVLEANTDSGEPAIRTCVRECLEVLAKRIVWSEHTGFSEDNNEGDIKARCPQKQQRRRRKSHLSTARKVSNENDDNNTTYSSEDELHETADETDSLNGDDDHLSGYTGSEYDDDFRLTSSNLPSTSSSPGYLSRKKRKAISTRVAFSSSSLSSKKTRKNYSRETTRVLMNWYLQHGGKSPEPIHKEILAKQANKSLVQVSTWFQNARRRHHHKLIQYQRLSKQFPTKVHDYDSFVSFTEESALSRKGTATKKRSWHDVAEAHDEAGPPSPKRK